MIEATQPPRHFQINITGACNYRCGFCEIHYFYDHAKKRSGKLYPNNLTVEKVREWSPWIRGLDDFLFETGVGEPLLNKDFSAIIRLLREINPRLQMSMTTNGVLMNPEVQKALVETGFGHISVSMHAGTQQVYEDIQGHEFYKVWENLASLNRLKKEYGTSIPEITLNFGINNKNAKTVKALFQQAKLVGVNAIHVYHYYQTRNKMNNDCSLYMDPKEANLELTRIYNLAAAVGVQIVPSTPAYVPIVDSIPEDAGEHTNVVCEFPWTNLQLFPCHDEENKRYAAICNRGLFMKVDLSKWDKTFNIADIWNHPTIKYMRMTSNSPARNPICRLCRGSKAALLRTLNPDKYSAIRDQAVRDFFSEVRSCFPDFVDPDGIETLDRNPYEADSSDLVTLGKRCESDHKKLCTNCESNGGCSS